MNSMHASTASDSHSTSPERLSRRWRLLNDVEEWGEMNCIAQLSTLWKQFIKAQKKRKQHETSLPRSSKYKNSTGAGATVRQPTVNKLAAKSNQKNNMKLPRLRPLP